MCEKSPWIYRTEVLRGISRWRVEHRVHYFGPQMHKQPCIVCFIQLPPPTELPPKSQWIMELYSYLHAHAAVLTVSKKWSKKLQSLIPISVIQLNPRCNTNSNNKLKCHCKPDFQHIYIFTYLHSPDETLCFVYKGHRPIVIEVEVLDPRRPSVVDSEFLTN